MSTYFIKLAIFNVSEITLKKSTKAMIKYKVSYSSCSIKFKKILTKSMISTPFLS